MMGAPLLVYLIHQVLLGKINKNLAQAFWEKYGDYSIVF